MKNIALIGMPGSGKSTVGVVLAKMLAPFLDSDLVIQETEGKLLSEIIEEKKRLTDFWRWRIGSTPICSVRRRSQATGGSGVVFGANAMGASGKRSVRWFI